MRAMSEQLPVCVIGAGVSGLVAVKQLTDRGIEVDCFEIGSDIGGNWRYDNDNGRSAAYASLHIDTSKERFALADLPMPASWPAYLHHSQVLSYLERYADTYGVRDHIRFRHEVASVTPDGDAWEVAVIDLDGDEVLTARYRAVVVANGHHWNPNLPETDGPFTGTIIHAQEYRTPEPFIGQDVVVVGVGNSGVDIAAELSWHAGSVTLAARTGAHVLPRYVFGRPLDNWSTRASSKLPLSVQRTLYRSLLFLARGRQESYGFPEPDAPILSQHPTVNQDVLRLVKEGLIRVGPGISRTTVDEVVFTDGSRTHADAIIYATGYTISFPFLDASIVDVEGNRVDLYKQVVAVDHPGLYFVGLIQPVGALPPLAEQQARWVAQLVDGAPLPTLASMKAEIARDREAREAQYLERPRHTIQVDYWPYLDDLAEVVGANDTLLSSDA
jgi:cation diffusion facilitator CzcD-associated flavoprotein CzcO